LRRSCRCQEQTNNQSEWKHGGSQRADFMRQRGCPFSSMPGHIGFHPIQKRADSLCPPF
jgi:hypothetical protein